MAVAGEVEFGGAGGAEELEGGLDELVIEIRHGVGLQPMMEDAAEEGGVEGFELGGDGEAAIGLDGLMGGEPGVGLGLQAIVIAQGLAGEAGEGGCDVALEDLAEQGKGLMTEAIAAVGGGLIAGVLAKGEVVLSDVGIDLAAPPGKKGTMEDEAVAQGLLGFDAGDAGESAAAAGVGEHGFGLVLSVMGEENVRGAVTGGHFTKEAVSGLAGGGLERELMGFGESGDVDFLDFAGQVPLFGKAADQCGVLAGFETAQAVVEVADDEGAVPLANEPVEERDGVAAA
jgi:hypothetical protein